MVGGWSENSVVELDGAVSDGSDDDGVMGFGPSDVIDAIGSVIGTDRARLRDGRGLGRGRGHGGRRYRGC